MIEDINETKSDKELISDFQKGDESAFDILVIRHQNKILNLCYRFLDNYEEAKDIAQEAFIKAYFALNKFRKEASFQSWMYRIAMNLCKNKVVSKGYRNSRKNLPIETSVGEERFTTQKNNPCALPQEELSRKENEELVQKALSTLEILQRQLIIYRDIEGFSYEEIVKTTGIKLGTVKSKLARARHVLTAKLRKMYEMP